MKTIATTIGKSYSVTTARECSISTPEGVTIITCPAGQQTVFIAPSESVIASDDEAIVTSSFNSAAPAVSGGGGKVLSEHISDTSIHVTPEQVSNWDNNCGVPGPQGEQGPPGPQGPQGEQGPTGPAVSESELAAMVDARLAALNLPPAASFICSLSSYVEGYLLCDGRAVERLTYSRLFAAIGTRFGSGDGVSTFNVPDARGRVLWGAQGTSAVGSLIEAGLPNITGSAHGSRLGYEFANTMSSVGALSVARSGVAGAANQEGSVGLKVALNASYSNAIYGNSDTVQPPALAVNVFIKY